MDGVLRQCLVSVSAVIVAILLGMLLILLMGKIPSWPSARCCRVRSAA